MRIFVGMTMLRGPRVARNAGWDKIVLTATPAALKG